MDSLIYILDEPTVGLHESEKAELLKAIQALKELGNTVAKSSPPTDSAFRDRQFARPILNFHHITVGIGNVGMRHNSAMLAL